MTGWQGPTYQGMNHNHLCVFLSSGVCLVMSESSGNTAAVGPPNTDGSTDHGLFQVGVQHNGSWVRTQPRREFQRRILSCCNSRTTHKRNRKLFIVNWQCIKQYCTNIVTVATISFLYLTYVTLHNSRHLSKPMLYRTTSYLYVACDVTDRNRYSILSTSL